MFDRLSADLHNPRNEKRSGGKELPVFSTGCSSGNAVGQVNRFSRYMIVDGNQQLTLTRGDLDGFTEIHFLISHLGHLKFCSGDSEQNFNAG
ncbi:hypothetical protein [Crateriforma conspicua]|nr:hypothetical protein [Crateriforma conspicua]